MNQADAPSYEWGQSVQAATDLFNDGSFPEQSPDALLVRSGDQGEIVQVGEHVESGMAVYMVEFALNRVIGCFEPELVPWQPSPTDQGAL